ncbi:hypothetical protein V0R37_15090 [Pollutimonas sp. H1-120]|uniref:hypothetical protein n=1 Tax=Pollutimonas sp. H1-120 TaxID=3148824 RepID=UPI003B52D6BC
MNGLITKKQAATAQNKIALAAAGFVFAGIPGFFLAATAIISWQDGGYKDFIPVFLAIPAFAIICGIYALRKAPATRDLLKRYQAQQNSQ